jgi:hypothetical protein
LTQLPTTQTFVALHGSGLQGSPTATGVTQSSPQVATFPRGHAEAPQARSSVWIEQATGDTAASTSAAMAARSRTRRPIRPRPPERIRTAFVAACRMASPFVPLLGRAASGAILDG